MNKLITKTALTFAIIGGGMLGAFEAQAFTLFSDRTSFENSINGILTEGFEEANVTTSFAGPLNSSTNNGIFSTGDILSGITFSASSGNLYTAAPGQSSNPTQALGQNSPASASFDITFDQGVNAVAFDIFQNSGLGSQTGVPQDYLVSLFNGTTNIADFNVTALSGQAGGFFGVSTNIPNQITSVSINNSSLFEVVDNVSFSSEPVQDVPEPLTILGTSVALGLGTLMKRRKSQAE